MVKTLRDRLRAGVDPTMHEYEFARKGIGQEAAAAIDDLLNALKMCLPGVAAFEGQDPGADVAGSVARSLIAKHNETDHA